MRVGGLSGGGRRVGGLSGGAVLVEWRRETGSGVDSRGAGSVQYGIGGGRLRVAAAMDAGTRRGGGFGREAGRV